MGILDSFTKKDKSGDEFEINPNAAVRKKQVKIIFTLIGVFALIGLYVMNSGKEAKEAYKVTGMSKDSVNKDFSALSDVSDEKDIWMTTGVQKIKQLTQKQKELEEVILSQASKNEKAIIEAGAAPKSEIERLRQELKEIKDKLDAQSQIAVKNKSGAIEKPKGELTVSQKVEKLSKKEPIVIKNRFFEKKDISGFSKEKNTFSRAPSITTPQPMKTVVLMSDEEIKADNAVVEKIEPVITKDNRKRIEDYTPAGSFFRAVILGGVDAPTGGQAQDNPHPVLMRVDDLAFLPNNFRFDVKSCNITGTAYGDISSERAIVRTEKISCISNDGFVYEKKIKGHLYGEDGKAGIRGTLVSKQGQVLANALFAGVGAGIGQAFQQQASNYSTSALGSVQSIDADKIGMAGAGAGVSTALNKLSEYYINLAEQMFPVIEVSAGRVGDIVLVSGIDWTKDDNDTPLVQTNVEYARQAATEMVNSNRQQTSALIPNVR